MPRKSASLAFLSPVQEKNGDQDVNSATKVPPPPFSPPTNVPAPAGPTLSFDDNHIRVACRVRPPNSKEASFSIDSAASARAANAQSRNGDDAVEAVAETRRCLAVLEDRTSLVLNAKPTPKVFTFDYAIHETASQEDIFNAIGRPITACVLEGYNSTVLAYGQTGSGKSHTMFGPEALMATGGVAPVGGSGDGMRGLVPRALEYLFQQIARESRRTNGKLEYSCKCSFFEIFNERVFDLLDAASAGTSANDLAADARASSSSSSSDRSSGASDRSSRSSFASSSDNNGSGSSRSSRSSFMGLQADDLVGLQVREDQRRGVYVDGLNETLVLNAAEAGKALGKGYRNRRVAETAMNRESSRSHAVFQLVVESVDKSDTVSGVKKTKASRFSLVDLAGSERQKSTSATGERLKEANAINKSLSALGLVINCLVDRGLGKMRHVPYRDSKLTFLLRDSLGGNSRTTLVATVSPAEEQFGESLSTLKFSQRAKMITNTAVVNEDTVGSLETLQKEVTRLRQELLKSQYALKNGDGGQQAQKQQQQQVSQQVTEQVVTKVVPVDDQLLVATLERFKVVHARSLRYQGQKMRANELQRKHEELLKIANFTIKILRSKTQPRLLTAAPSEGKQVPSSPSALIESDPELSRALVNVEKNLLKLPETEKWRVACDAMRAEIEALTGVESLSSWMADLKEVTGDKAKDDMLTEAVKALNAGKRARDFSLGLGGFAPKVAGVVTSDTPKKEAVQERSMRLSLAWTPVDEATFNTALQDRLTKVVAERDGLQAQLKEALLNASASGGGDNEGGLTGGSPESSAASRSRTESNDDELDAMFGANFGSLTDAGNILDSLPKRSSSSAGGRRSSVGRLSVSGGGRLSVGGGLGGSDSVAGWAQTQELQRKLRDADGKAEALRREVAEKERALAEQGRLNSVLAREKAELNAALSAQAAAASSTSADDSTTEQQPSSSVSSEVVEAAVLAAVADAVAAKEEELAAMREELEANQVARFNDKESFEQSEAKLRELAQAEIENAENLRAQHDLAAAAAGAESEKAQLAADEAMAAQREAAEAKEEQDAALARVKALEDEMETLGEQVSYMQEQQKASVVAAQALEASLQESAVEVEMGAKALESQKAVAASLQKQLAQTAEAAGQSEAEAVEALRATLAEEAAKLATSVEEAEALQGEVHGLTKAMAAAEARVEEVSASLSSALEREGQATEVSKDLTSEVVSLRESLSAAEALAARHLNEYEAVVEDRDEIAKEVVTAQKEMELAQDILEEEKANYLEELDRVQAQCNELEAALEEEQQVMLDAGSSHAAELDAAKAAWEAEKCTLQAEVSACLARAEQAEAESLVLARDTQRGVSEAEKELLACRASLKQEEKRRTEAEASGLVSAAKAEEQLQTTQELKLAVASLEKERENILGGVVKKDVELEATIREAKDLKEEVESKNALLKALECRAQVAEEAVAEKAVAADVAEAQRSEAVDECERLKTMEAEAFAAREVAESASHSMQEELDEAIAKFKEISEENAVLTGQGNHKQKIHYHEKLKDQMDDLKAKNSDLMRENKALVEKLARKDSSEEKALVQLNSRQQAPPPLPPPPKAFNVPPPTMPLPPDENVSPARPASAQPATDKITGSDLCMSSPQPAPLLPHTEN